MCGQERCFNQDNKVCNQSVVLCLEPQECFKLSSSRPSNLVPSSTGNKGTGKTSSLPEPQDFTGLWSSLHRSKNADPESLVETKKPFYLRTWFACVLYVLLLSLLVAAILALAVNRAILVPKTTLQGEIYLTIERSQHGSSVTTVLSLTTAASIASEALITTTVLPEISTTPSLTTRIPDVAALLLSS